LVFALDADTARRMTELFTEGAVDKTYLAVVRGYTDETGTIDYALEERLDRMTDANAQRDKPAQPAITHYCRLGIAELPFAVGRYPTARYSLLRVSPKTGRKHQIRRHMKHIFHPVLGDTSHGDGRHNDFFRNHFGCHRLLLCATGLAFTHPHTGERLRLEAPLDDSFRRIVDNLGWTDLLSEAPESGQPHKNNS
jgi:tRNA pseudouridine65 synthase